MVWLSGREKIGDRFTRFDTIQERDGQTNRQMDRRANGQTVRQTTHDGIGRAYA